MATYTVKAGDTLGKIAAQQGVKVSDISGYRSGNPNLIYAGEVLSFGAPSQTSGANPVYGPTRTDFKPISSTTTANAPGMPGGPKLDTSYVPPANMSTTSTNSGSPSKAITSYNQNTGITATNTQLPGSVGGGRQAVWVNGKQYFVDSGTAGVGGSGNVASNNASNVGGMNNAGNNGRTNAGSNGVVGTGGPVGWKPTSVVAVR